MSDFAPNETRVLRPSVTDEPLVSSKFTRHNATVLSWLTRLHGAFPDWVRTEDLLRDNGRLGRESWALMCDIGLIAGNSSATWLSETGKRVLDEFYDSEQFGPTLRGKADASSNHSMAVAHIMSQCAKRKWRPARWS